MSLNIEKDQIWYDKDSKAVPVNLMSEYQVKNALRMLIKFFNNNGIEDIHEYVNRDFNNCE